MNDFILFISISFDLAPLRVVNKPCESTFENTDLIPSEMNCFKKYFLTLALLKSYILYDK